MSTADALTCLAFSPDGNKIACGTARSGVTITDISSKSKHQLEMLAETHTHVTAVAWSPDGEKIIVALPDHTICCWNTISTHPVGPPFAEHKDLILTAGLISRSKLVKGWRVARMGHRERGSHSTSNSVKYYSNHEGIVWEIPKCGRIAEIALPNIPLLQAAIISHSGPQVVLAFGDRSFWIWDTSTKKHDDARFEGLSEDDIPFAMAASPDGKLLALEIDGDINHPTHFYDLKGHEFTTSNMRCTHPFAFSPDGKLFAASSVPSDSKDGIYKLVIRSVEEARILIHVQSRLLTKRTRLLVEVPLM
ncbi:hypothetical protein F4604DRAFT_1932637 [Suillus subluteus]|nr:hypothetical protein F4604DRAFT_1932637 [Suillus subluteus]